MQLASDSLLVSCAAVAGKRSVVGKPELHVRTFLQADNIA